MGDAVRGNAVIFILELANEFILECDNILILVGSLYGPVSHWFIFRECKSNHVLWLAFSASQ